ncbi:hypothetical protein FIBSPDRAFT_1047956 [Athelia psychrophila]|uniref:Osmotin thaumatin-like protein n=1 Tax=Athelia psychrophila TaxID=1759441 RepID=A0A166EGN7_9AGAM|nr:hypothetical protein FIBSPDRAFT_1047956 [Fibularhizoctonia sp. CBS 109695]
MFTYTVVAFTALASLFGAARAESHQVTFTNNCGKGSPLFLYQGGGPQGAGTINGELNGGIAWLGNADNCLNSGVNCGAVEFSLQNTGYSQADITLEVGPNGSWGNHQWTYPVQFNFINGCGNGLNCPAAGCSAASYSPTQVPLEQCSANNAGIHIQFC